MSKKAPKSPDAPDTLEIVKSYLREIVLKIWIVLLLSGGMGGLLFLVAISTPPTYTAQLTFMLNDATPVASLGGIYDAFLGTQSSGSANLDKITEMLKSRRIVRDALFTRVNIAGKDDFLINHYLDKLSENQFRYAHDSFPIFNINENKALKNIHSKITKTMLTYFISPAGVVTVNVTTESEAVSFHFLNILYQATSQYYIQTTVEKQQVIYDRLLKRVEELKGKLSGAEKALAEDFDSHLGPVRLAPKVRQQGMQREVNITARSFYEAASSLEGARISLENKTPVIQLIDEPLMPLTEKKADQWFNLLIGAIIGLFVGILIVVGRKFVREMMQKEKAPPADEGEPKDQDQDEDDEDDEEA
jgi:uncharacterized protein involved in exopolysaccharide biosynthesis